MPLDVHTRVSQTTAAPSLPPHGPAPRKPTNTQNAHGAAAPRAIHKPHIARHAKRSAQQHSKIGHPLASPRAAHTVRLLLTAPSREPGMFAQCCLPQVHTSSGAHSTPHSPATRGRSRCSATRLHSTHPPTLPAPQPSPPRARTPSHVRANRFASHRPNVVDATQPLPHRPTVTTHKCARHANSSGTAKTTAPPHHKADHEPAPPRTHAHCHAAACPYPSGRPHTSYPMRYPSEKRGRAWATRPPTQQHEMYRIAPKTLRPAPATLTSHVVVQQQSECTQPCRTQPPCCERQPALLDVHTSGFASPKTPQCHHPPKSTNNNGAHPIISHAKQPHHAEFQ